MNKVISGVALLYLHCFFNFWLGAQDLWKATPLEKKFYSGFPLACADINGDKLDDILALDQTKHLWVGLQCGNSQFLWKPLDYHHSMSAWSVNVADLDNNGYNDIVISGEATQVNVMMQDAKGFTRIVADDSYFFSQAGAIFDINQDGWLDFTLCDDNHANKVYLNSGNGILKPDTHLIKSGFTQEIFHSGNYGCIWTDLENDGDPDLYISKCRPGVEDTMDPRRLNQLFIHENGAWRSAAAEFGLDVGDQSWISIFEDFDNDGLKDCFVVNHYSPCRLFHQNANHRFVEVTQESGFNSGVIGIQALPIDYDNDGDLDILLTGNGTELWDNSGNMKFQKISGAFQSTQFSSCAFGDYNRDGFVDLYVSHADLLNTPNNRHDELWLNPGNDNHHVIFSFIGTRSNVNGIGVRVNLFINGTLQTRELHAGEGFGIQNSLNLHFGTGTRNHIDSIHVYWPSGTIDRYTDFSTDQQYVLEEGNCMNGIHASSSGNIHYYCTEIDTTLKAEQSLSSIKWVTGEVSKEIQIAQEGVYYYWAKDTNNCLVISNPLVVIRNPKEDFNLNFAYEELLCFGNRIRLTTNLNRDVNWSTGQRSNAIEISGSGFYFAMDTGFCEQILTDTLQLIVTPPVAPPTLSIDSLWFPRPAQWDSGNDSTQWFVSASSQLPIFIGSRFISDTLYKDTSFWVENIEYFSYPYVHGGLKVPEYQNAPYHAAFLNNQMLFNVYEDVILDSVTVFTDFPGLRIIDLLDDLGQRMAKKEVELVTGMNKVYLGFEIPASSKLYILTTNIEQNQKLFGENSPRLYRSDKGFYYPFFIQDKLRIVTSNKGDSYYYYFYDWVIRSRDISCSSERVEVKAKFKTTNNIHLNDVKLNFIWTLTGLKLEISNHEDWRCSLFTVDGKLLMQEVLNDHSEMKCSALLPGYYAIRLWNGKTKPIWNLVFKPN